MADTKGEYFNRDMYEWLRWSQVAHWEDRSERATGVARLKGG